MKQHIKNDVKRFCRRFFPAIVFVFFFGTVAKAQFNCVADGDWADGATWGSACVSCIEGIDYPGPGDGVSISSYPGYNVTVTGTNSCGSLSIGSSGGGSEGSLSVTGSLTVSGSVDADDLSAYYGHLNLYNSGTLNIGGDLTIGLQFVNDGVLTCGGGLILNSGQCMGGYGKGTITNNGTLTAGTIQLNYVCSGGGMNNTGTVTTGSILGSDGYSNDANSWLNLTDPGNPSTVTGFSVNSGGNTVVYKGGGAQTIRSTSYYNLTTSVSGTKTLGGSVSVGGDLTIDAGTVLDVNPVTGYDITLSGNWINNAGAAGFTPRNKTVTLNGGASQTITNAAGETFNNLVLNNSYGTVPQVILNNDASVLNTLMLINGVLDLNSKILTIKNTATAAISGGGSNTYLLSENISNLGKVQWNARTSTGNYVVPLGVNIAGSNFYIPFKFNKTTAGTESTVGNFRIATYHTDPVLNLNNRPLPPGVANTIISAGEKDINLVDRWWQIDVSGYSAGPTADVTFTYPDPEWNASAGSRNVITESNLKAVRWNGASYDAATGTVATASNEVTVTGLSAFSTWTLGGNIVALPINLLSFTGQNMGKTNMLYWSTASELNNDYFTLQKSMDGINFETLGTKAGAGNSSVQNNYSMPDENPYLVTFYRLKQTDFNGASTYSNIISITMKEGIDIISIYPNPSSGSFQYTLGSSIDETVNVTVIDVLGRKTVMQSNIPVLKGITHLNIDVSTFSSGTYMLQVATSSGNYNVQKKFECR